MKNFQRTFVLGLSISMMLGQSNLVLARSAYSNSEPAAGLSGAAASAARAEARARALKQQGAKPAPYQTPQQTAPASPVVPSKPVTPVILNKKGVLPKGRYQMAPAAPVVAPLTNLPDIPNLGVTQAKGLSPTLLPGPVDSAVAFAMEKLSDPNTSSSSSSSSKAPEDKSGNKSESKKSNSKKSESKKSDSKKSDSRKNKGEATEPKASWRDLQTDGIAAFKNRDYSLAMDKFIKAVQAQPKNEESRHLLALTFIRQRDYDKALEMLESILNINPKNNLVLFDRAYVNYRKENFSKAAEDYSSYLTKDPANRDALEGRILSYTKARDAANLRASLQDYLPRFSNTADALELAGDCYLTVGDNQAALDSYNALLRIKPDYSAALGGIAKAMSAVGNTKGAIDLLAKKGTYEKLLPVQLNDFAYLQYMSGDVTAAFDSFTNKLGSDYQIARDANQNIYLQKTMEKLVRQSRQGKLSSADYQRLYQGYLLVQDYRSAFLCADYLTKTDPTFYSGYFGVGLCLYSEHRWKEALKYFSESIKLSPNYAFAWTMRSSCYINLGDYKTALIDAEKARDLDPNAAASWTNLSNRYRLLKDYDKALACIDKALSIDKNFDAAYEKLAVIRWDQKDYPAAGRAYNKAMELNPFESSYLSNRGRLFFASGDKDQYKIDTEKAYAMNPNSPQMNVDLGTCYADLRMFDKSLNYLDNAIALKTFDENVYYYRGLDYLGLGNVPAAKKELARYAGESDAQRSYEVMDLLWSYDLLDDAAYYGNRVMKLDPANTTCMLKMSGIERGRKNYPRSIALMREGSRNEKDRDAIERNVAYAYRFSNQPQEAEKILNQLVAKNPNKANLGERADFYNDYHRIDEELADLDNILKIDAKASGSIMRKILLLAFLGKKEEALALYENSYAKPPLSEKGNYNLYISIKARIFGMVGEPAAGIEIVNKGFDIVDDNSNLDDRCFLQVQSGQYEEAIKSAMELLRTKGPKHEYSRQLFYCLPWFCSKMLGKNEEAAAYLDSALAGFDKSWPQPLVEFLAGKLSDSQLLDKCEGGSKLTTAHFYIGLKNLANGQKDAARTQFDWVLQKGVPSSYEAMMAKGLIARVRGN